MTYSCGFVLGLAACAFLVSACSRAAEAQASACADPLAAIRALRDGPQACTSPSECTVWHNGTYWDGCPREITARNAARLDAMRAAFEARGCRVETHGACAPSAIRGCVHGACGGF